MTRFPNLWRLLTGQDPASIYTRKVQAYRDAIEAARRAHGPVRLIEAELRDFQHRCLSGKAGGA
jgi:hypothetical protein